jgi:hypothetical protein
MEEISQKTFDAIRSDGFKTSKWLISIQIFLFILILIGIFLLVTQRFWVPKLVEKILEQETRNN